MSNGLQTRGAKEVDRDIFRLSGTGIDNDREVMPEGELGASEDQFVVIKEDRRRSISRGC